MYVSLLWRIPHSHHSLHAPQSNMDPDPIVQLGRTLPGKSLVLMVRSTLQKGKKGGDLAFRGSCLNVPHMESRKATYNIDRCSTWAWLGGRPHVLELADPCIMANAQDTSAARN